jgi:acyl-CoA synthetase (AMP-forming)/AMP-acid ligase II
VAWNEQSERWTYLYSSPNYTVATWSPATENIGPEEYVIVIRPDETTRYVHFTKDTSTPPKAFASKYKDVLTNYAQPDTTSIIFSLGTTSTPKMAFNRGDYYIANTDVPTRCAQGTGVLYKAVVDLTQNSTGFLPPLPLLDCVADMQIAYRFADDNGAYANQTADVPAGSNQPLTAEDARQVREVRVYILAQEGQMDRNFTYSNSIVRVGEAGIYGRDFDLNATITNWQNYRWKLYTLIIQPLCLVNMR